ncbi:MAG TPA: hypothetical protein VGH44_02605 [Candidatus Saccharimonadia bacterium]|jgi:hypothetical protein
MKKLKLLAYTLSLAGMLAAAPVLAAKPAGAGKIGPGLGMDVSYPQCGKSLPTTPAFAVVGVNGGVANNFNRCFSSELTWAEGASGGTQQPKVSVYVNTGNPGDVLAQYNLADWPTSTNPADPYGSCMGVWTDDLACSWEYGYERAQGDVGYAGSGARRWWLDVETSNSWTIDAAKNRAALEGMVYGLTEAGGTVGLYSTAGAWSSVAGAVPMASPLYALPEWRPGAETQRQAQSNCSLSPLTGGGHITLTQYTTTLDYDYSCIN